ncbi:MAG: AAA family ATPase [Pseudodonghicola sp.]
MTEISRMNNGGGIAALRNVMSMVTLVQRVVDRGPMLPGMATFYGPSGFGKTTAATYAANVYNAVHIEVRSTWTKKTFAQVLCEELGLPGGRTVADMVNQIARELEASLRPLFVDEADTAVQRGMLEMIRDLYEMSGTAVILIGEENLPRTLTKSERVHGRMLDWVGAEAAVLEDVFHLAPHYAAGVEIEDSLAELLLHDSGHSIRRVCVNLAALQEHARSTGKDRISKRDWMQSGERFSSGKAPKPRGGL